MDEDREHLRLLSIFFYVVGGLTALIACVPFIHFFIGLAITVGAFGSHGGPPAFFGLIFMGVAAIMIALGWAVAISLFCTGKYMGQYRHHTFCLVTSAIACAFFPFGTVLGVLALIVLSRASVKTLFGTAASASGTAVAAPDSP